MVERRLAELAERAGQRDAAVFSRFLDPAEQLLARNAARRAQIGLRLEGGQPQSERKMAAFFPEDGRDLEWPFVCIQVTWDARYGTVRHPDLLGASLALAQDRSCFGDIWVEEGKAYLFVVRELSEHIAQSMTEAGRVRLQNTVLAQWPDPPEQRVRTRRDTVASLRLDALAASAFDLSRSQAQDLIREGRVKVNHMPTLQTDAQLVVGDLLSLRGHGRAQLTEVGGKNRKGRTAIVWSCCE
ncbi:MAG TPA: YlmH/Sll1252 family protein [Clostridia bacterium]|nr:YlmH/Sll1252 family protein [Clostridia bacterium]